MEIIVLKTFEITPSQWSGIVEGFNKSFGTNKDIKVLKDHYLRTIRHYSFHVLALNEENRLIGYNSLLPMLYSDANGNDIEIGVSGGTFVDQAYRKDIFIFADMINSLLKYSSDEGIVAMVGVSNENSFKYALKFLDANLISFLNYYCLPVRIMNILKKKNISFLNSLSVAFSRFLLGSNIFFSRVVNPSEKKVQFELKITEQFLDLRFNNEKYTKINYRNYTIYYRTLSENGIRTTYLFDFRENNLRTFKALVFSIKTILKEEKPDMILFIGHLRLVQFILFKVPVKFEPQRLPLTFNITSSKNATYIKNMSSDSNWNFGLMNFDVR